MRLKQIKILLLITLFLKPTLLCSGKFHEYRHYIDNPRNRAIRKMNNLIGMPRKLAESEYRNLRILYDISDLISLNYTKPNAYSLLVEEILPSVLQHISETLEVNGPEIMQFPKNTGGETLTCADHTIPPSYYGTLFKTDLILFITLDYNLSDGTLAWASPCSLTPITMRPVTGRVTFNPNHFSSSGQENFNDVFSTTIHEVYHILGLNPFLYQYFYNRQTGKIRPTSEVYKTDTTDDYPTRIITPKVVEVAREHFGCDTITGVPMENNGGSGSVGAHWEKNFLMNDFMVAILTPHSVISKFTLALMEDTGWYKVNYNYSEPLFFGRNKGCEFVKKNECHIYGKTCTELETEAFGCHYDYQFKTYCAKNTFMDDCKFYTYADNFNMDCRRTKDTLTEKSKAIKEFFGPFGRCFHTEITEESTKIRHACYKSYCNDLRQVVIEIGETEFTCATSGQILNLSPVLSGFITCPDLEDFCLHNEAKCPDDCNLNGRCHENGVCYCYSKYSGNACQKKDGVDIIKEAEDQDGNETKTTEDPVNCDPICISGKCVKNETNADSPDYCQCFEGYQGKNCNVEVTDGNQTEPEPESSGITNEIFAVNFIIFLMWFK